MVSTNIFIVLIYRNIYARIEHQLRRTFSWTENVPEKYICHTWHKTMSFMAWSATQQDTVVTEAEAHCVLTSFFCLHQQINSLLVVLLPCSSSSHPVLEKNSRAQQKQHESFHCLQWMLSVQTHRLLQSLSLGRYQLQRTGVTNHHIPNIIHQSEHLLCLGLTAGSLLAFYISEGKAGTCEGQ